MDCAQRKRSGSFYTPKQVVQSLVRWAVRSPTDVMLDPACGDGRFLTAHPRSAGVEQDPVAAAIAESNAPGRLAHRGDFFSWAAGTRRRFECAAGNPPFIRYQRFTGEVRRAAIELCERHGAKFNRLSSSWAPFLAATATLLKPGGRMAFVVPAEIGHAPYAKPLLEYLADHFDIVHVVAVRRKLFPHLSEDCWLLYCEGFGGRTRFFRFSALDEFDFAPVPPPAFQLVSFNQWHLWNRRLRPFLMPALARDLYQALASGPDATRLGDVARVGIGYVTGANDFFHMRPSDARRLRVPDRFLQPAVRNGRALAGRAITNSTIAAWRRRDEPMLLLCISTHDDLPSPVQRYLDSPAGQRARVAYKCRTRRPWWVVPDVSVPDAFLSYMTDSGAALVANRAGCVGTNSVHVVNLTGSMSISKLQRCWGEQFTTLSCEVEGHPLGGGLLKLEPTEAGRVLLSCDGFTTRDAQIIQQGIEAMRRWRHHGR